MKKIALYSPYLDTASGGEKYMLTIAEFLSQKNQVDVLLDSHLLTFGIENLKEQNEKPHGLDLSKVNFIHAPIGKDSSNLKRMKFLKKYDVLFYNSDGSFFFSTAKKNIAHIQLPLANIKPSLIDKLKLKSWSLIIYNSKFTQGFVDPQLGIASQVVYPPVSTEDFKPLNKQKQILSVGRFVSFNNPKKQDVMINFFKTLVNQYKLNDWTLHLAGGLMPGNEKYLEDLRSLAKGYKIEFHPNIKLKELITLYGESTIYWHAMGYQEDDPIKMEHFGISTVEAMSAGCVPIVINKGGQKEIIENGKTGFLWNNAEECIEQTLNIIHNEQLKKDISIMALKNTSKFSKISFERTIQEIVG